MVVDEGLVKKGWMASPRLLRSKNYFVCTNGTDSKSQEDDFEFRGAYWVMGLASQGTLLSVYAV